VRVDHLSLERVEVVLSERNLIALLNKVRRTDSFRTLEFDEPVEDDGALPGEPPAHLRLVVRAEPDDEHYDERPTPPGPVYPEDLQEPADLSETRVMDPVREVPPDEQPTRVLTEDDIDGLESMRP
jgi:hypothetical protein